VHERIIAHSELKRKGDLARKAPLFPKELIDELTFPGLLPGLKIISRGRFYEDLMDFTLTFTNLRVNLFINNF